MEEKGFMLEWKGYNSSSKTFQNLYEDKDFTDVTLVCDDNARLEVHKVIVSSCSEFFSQILKQNPHPHPLIYLQGVSIGHLQLLKSFMYIGRTKVNLDQIDGFLEISKRFLNQPSDDISPQHQTSDNGQTSTPNTITQESKVKVEKKKKRTGKAKVDLESTSNSILNQLSHAIGKTESCLQCSFKCENKRALTRHRFRKHIDQNLACSGPDCGKVFKNKSILNDHVKRKHVGGNTRQYLCEKCDYATKWRASFQRHQSKHIGNQKQCHHCEYSCADNYGLNLHFERKHSDIEYKCDQCDVSTRTRRMMKFHVGKVHDGVRYYCELCSHQATTAYNLKTHTQRTHEHIEFKCTFCDFKDSEKSRTLLHEKRTHG